MTSYCTLQIGNSLFSQTVSQELATPLTIEVPSEQPATESRPENKTASTSTAPEDEVDPWPSPDGNVASPSDSLHSKGEDEPEPQKDSSNSVNLVKADGEKSKPSPASTPSSAPQPVKQYHASMFGTPQSVASISSKASVDDEPRENDRVSNHYEVTVSFYGLNSKAKVYKPRNGKDLIIREAPTTIFPTEDEIDKAWPGPLSDEEVNDDMISVRSSMSDKKGTKRSRASSDLFFNPESPASSPERKMRRSQTKTPKQ